MSKSENQKSKILYIMRILLEKTDEEHLISTAEIIEELAVYGISAERKSVYADINSLREYGLDIELRKGAEGGYYVAAREFELPELKLLVDAVQSSKFITAKKSGELIKKLESLVSAGQAKQLQRQVFVHNRVKTMNESIYYNVDSISAAISEDKQIAFGYFDWNEKKEKVFRKGGKLYCVSPWALTWDNENYYLIAYDSESEGIKHYRVDKMSGIKQSPSAREGKEKFKDFDVANYAKKTFSMFGGENEFVTLICKNEKAGLIFDRFGRDVSVRNAKDGWFEVTVEVTVSDQFITWLIGLGDEVKIVSPEKVINRYKEVARRSLEIYRQA